MTDYCSCGEKADRLCRSCRIPTCLRHYAHPIAVELGFGIAWSPQGRTDGFCATCGPANVRVVSALPEFAAFTRNPTAFETAAAFAAMERCLGPDWDHVCDRRCCPTGWSKGTGIGANLISAPDVRWILGTNRHRVSGPWVNGFTLADLAAAFTDAAKRNHLPTRTIRVSRWKTRDAFLLPGPSGCLETVAFCSDGSVLSENISGSWTSLREDLTASSWWELLGSSHYALRGVPCPGRHKDYGP